jgi:hypothetical protein
MMNELSLFAINEKAPYHVLKGELVGSFRFFTDNGVQYSVDFIPDDLITEGESYQLIIANVNNRKSPRDTKVKDSVLVIIDEFFKKNQSTLLYICETGDGKQSMRSRLFEHWFNSYDRKMLFTLLTTSIVDEEGEYKVYTSVPNFQSVVEGLEASGFKSTTAEFTRVPQNTIAVTDEKVATNIMRLLSRLEEHDDVQNVYANFDIDDALMESLNV